jgi:16S rRNA processing protein RimM
LYGVRGWVKLFSYTDPREAILKYTDCRLKQDGRWSAARLAEGRKQGKSIIARLDGIDDRDTAAALIGADIGVSRETLPQTGSGEYYWADLEGLQVVHQDGRALGRVAYLLATGANDVLVVQGRAAGDQEILIPFVADSVILDVDVAAGVISVNWEWD